MTEPLERDEVVGLLTRLGSERDEDVLEAARQVHARLTAAGNVELPMIFAGLERAQRSRRVARALDAVGLSDRADHRPEIPRPIWKQKWLRQCMAHPVDSPVRTADRRRKI